MKEHEVWVETSHKVDGSARKAHTGASQKVRVPAYINSRHIGNGHVLRIRVLDYKTDKFANEVVDGPEKREPDASPSEPPAKAAKTKGKKGKGKGKSK